MNQEFYIILTILTLYVLLRIRFPLPHQCLGKSLPVYLLTFYNPFAGKLVKVWELVLSRQARQTAKVFLEGMLGSGEGQIYAQPVNLEPPFKLFNHYQRFSKYQATIEPVILGFRLRFYGFFLILADSTFLYFGIKNSIYDFIIPSIVSLCVLFLLPFDRGLCPHIPSVQESKNDLIILQLQPSQHDQMDFSKAQRLLLSLADSSRPISFEILGGHDNIKIQIACVRSDKVHIEQQLYAIYPNIQILQADDSVSELLSQNEMELQVTDFALSGEYFYPLQVFTDFKNDPLMQFIGTLSDIKLGQLVFLQILTCPVVNPWNENINEALTNPGDEEGKDSGKPFYNDAPYTLKLGDEKSASKLFAVSFRLGEIASKNDGASYLNHTRAFTQLFDRHGSNSLESTANSLKPKQARQAVLERITFRHGMLLNSLELASIFHLSNSLLTEPKILKAYGVQRPLPVVAAGGDVLLGESIYRGEKKNVSIPAQLRNRHVYVLGFTRTGKSTLLLNMILQDIKAGRGVAVFDPHGDLVKEQLLPLIPQSRIEDVIYFNPADSSNPVAFNVLDTNTVHNSELLCSDLVNALQRLFVSSWGPRMEHILRYSIHTLLEVGDCTLLDILRLLSDRDFRDTAVSKISSPDLLRFWQVEFPSYSGTALGPVQNKLSKFALSKTMSAMLSQRENKVNVRKSMDTGKILLCNLAQGELGEDASHLLGALLVSQIQQAALSRATMSSASRRDFFLYVDEFQNYSTSSFEKILSEAGKYKLNLILCHQFTSQISDSFRQAIFGNVGTIISFRAGVPDVKYLSKELGDLEENDILNLARGQAAVRMGMSRHSFLMNTFPPPQINGEGFKSEIIQQSRAKYGTTSICHISRAVPVPTKQAISLSDEDFYE